MDKSRTSPVLVDLLEIDNELAGVVLRVSEDLGAEERDNVVGDDLDRLGLEVGVVDAEVSVEPVDLVGYEFTGDKALNKVVRRSVMVL